MTEPKPTQEQKLPAAANSEETTPSPADKNTGFFRKVRRELNSKPVHPSVEKEIVVDSETLEQP